MGRLFKPPTLPIHALWISYDEIRLAGVFITSTSLIRFRALVDWVSIRDVNADCFRTFLVFPNSSRASILQRRAKTKKNTSSISSCVASPVLIFRRFSVEMSNQSLTNGCSSTRLGSESPCRCSSLLLYIAMYCVMVWIRWQDVGLVSHYEKIWKAKSFGKRCKDKGVTLRTVLPKSLQMLSEYSWRSAPTGTLFHINTFFQRPFRSFYEMKWRKLAGRKPRWSRHCEASCPQSYAHDFWADCFVPQLLQM